MTKTQRLRMTVDITMTILSIILMGGNYLFPADIVHEILGVGLFVLWALHIILNRRWYGAIFKGKYNPYRVMQTIINCCILICTIFLMISGIILSNHIFTFLNIQCGLGFARIAHLLASHWYYLFMSLHIGLHVGVIANIMRHPAPINCHPELDSGSHAEEMPKQVRNDKLRKIIPRILLAWSALTAFTLSSLAECGNILSFSSSFSSLIWNAATFFLLLIIFPLSFCLLHSRTFWQRV